MPNRSVYERESSSTGWFVGIIVALAMLCIGYLVFSANASSGERKCASTHQETVWVERDANANHSGPYVETWVPLTVTKCDTIEVPVL